MGNDQSQQAQSQQNNLSQNTTTSQQSYQEDQQFFVVEHLSKIKLEGSLSDMVFLWIDPRIYNDENSKNLKLFKEKLTIEEFSSLGSLKGELQSIDPNSIVVVISAASLPDQNYKDMQAEKRISEIILFCQNEERAKLLMSNFDRIRFVGYDAAQVLDKVKEIQSKHPSKGLIKNTALFMTEDDAGIMNKYRLNYFCLTNQRNRKKAKRQFEELCKKLYPNQLQTIDQFNKTYNLQLQPSERRKQTLQWLFKDSFYFSVVEALPKITTDPRKLAYLRTPVKDIYDCIFALYRENKRKPNELFIVVELTEEEKGKLQENQSNFLIFTTFVKGFTDEKKANEEFKRRGPNAWKFDVMQAKKLFEDLDFGFVWIDDDKTQPHPNVCFNIYNFFKIMDLSVKARRGTLEYGALAQAIKMRQDPNARSKMSPIQKNLLRNYDYLQDLMKKIKNQGNVLQLSGYYKESIQIYDKKLEQVTRTNKPATILDEFRLQKGDALRMSEEYDLAEKEYQSVQSEKLRLVAKIRLVELYFMRQNLKKAEEMISELEMDLDNLKDWGFMEEYFRAKNYVGLSFMKKEKFRQANKYYKALRNEISAFYDYKVEGIPLAHEIYRNLALSQTRLNNHEEALNLLNSTKNWQQSSEGKGPTLILTQKMIQNVHYSKGDKQAVEQAKEKIEKMVLQQSTVNINLIDASRGAVKIQQSIQQSMVNIDLDSSSPKTKFVNVQQSAVTIDL